MTGADLKRGWCPSLLRPMESGDGWLVRVRPRAGVITAGVARAVAEAATACGNGRIEITNRANLQIRGLLSATIAPFTAAMEAVGAADDEAAILVSPLAGADPGVAAETLAIADLVARGLDPRVYPGRPERIGAPEPVDARHEAAHDGEKAAHDDVRLELPAKFGFLIDGGGVLPLNGLSLDITLRCVEGHWLLNERPVRAGDAASYVVALARKLAEAPRQVAARSSAQPPLGFHPYGDGNSGAVLVAPAFGQLDAGQLHALANLSERWGDGKLRPTPWKSLAIAGVARADEGFLRDQVHQVRLITEPSDPRLSIVTCVGAPACSRGAVETHATATRLAAFRCGDEPLLHLSGCAKGCAHPGPAEVTLVGEGDSLALIRHGRAGDVPVARGLTLAQSVALMQSVPA